jgi:c-di-GMP-binding flagellar brake protein YcgR
MVKYPLKLTELFKQVISTVTEQVSTNKKQNEMRQRRILEFANISNHTIQERNILNKICYQIIVKEKELLKMF